MARFALLGAGYIAQRHIIAIHELGHSLEFAFDQSFTAQLPTHTSRVGQEQEFYSLLNKHHIDYVAICSPSYLHATQAIKCIQQGCHVILEKPTCLTLQELDQIQQAEHTYQRKAFTIYQLRYHEAVLQLLSAKKRQNQIIIQYKGHRDSSYFKSWKADIQLSGGIVNLVGSHFFDILIQYFGPLTSIDITTNTSQHSSGTLQLQQANVKWDFTFTEQTIPVQRQFLVNEQAIDFSTYQSELHTFAYQQILNQQGITTSEMRPLVHLLEQMRK